MNPAHSQGLLETRQYCKASAIMAGSRFTPDNWNAWWSSANLSKNSRKLLCFLLSWQQDQHHHCRVVDYLGTAPLKAVVLARLRHFCYCRPPASEYFTWRLDWTSTWETGAVLISKASRKIVFKFDLGFATSRCNCYTDWWGKDGSNIGKTKQDIYWYCCYLQMFARKIVCVQAIFYNVKFTCI